jgi:hypothetical protein
MRLRSALPALLLLLLPSPATAQDEGQLAALIQAGDFTRARALISQLIDREPAEPRHRYNLACAEARLGSTVLALEALEAAVQLGFRNRELLARDEDLASLRPHPRFQAAVQRLAAPPAAASQSVSPPVPVATPAAAAAPTSAPSLPAPNRLGAEGPSGLFFMTRFWAMSGSLEQKLWYFAPDGRVYDTPGATFTATALARESRRHGQRALQGRTLSVTWSDGKVTSSTYQVDAAGEGFSWDAGIFSPVRPPDWSQVTGHFEGGASFSGRGGGATSVSGLTLRADGTFSWNTSASLRAETSSSVATAGAAAGARTGRWRGEGYQLTLTFADGEIRRQVAFPVTSRDRPGQVEMLFFNGAMHLPKAR